MTNFKYRTVALTYVQLLYKLPLEVTARFVFPVQNYHFLGLNCFEKYFSSFNFWLNVVLED